MMASPLSCLKLHFFGGTVRVHQPLWRHFGSHNFRLVLLAGVLSQKPLYSLGAARLTAQGPGYWLYFHLGGGFCLSSLAFALVSCVVLSLVLVQPPLLGSIDL
jgi:hypothetical protein